MITPEAVQQLLTSSDRECLTLYFNTGPDRPPATYRARFQNLLRALNSAVPDAECRAFARVTERVAGFLGQLRPKGNSMLVVAGEKAWQEFHSRVPVRDEVAWGRPAVSQLLWLLEEYRPYGVILADQASVRFMAVRLNEYECYEEFKAAIDTSQWRMPRVGSAGRGGVVHKGGRNAEAFGDRYMENVRAFWRRIQRRLEELVERYHVRRLVIGVSRAVAGEFAGALSPKLSAMVVRQVTLEAFSSPADAVGKVTPVVEAAEEERQRGVVAALLDAAGVSRKAAVGVDAVLKYVQEGRAARLVFVRGTDGELRQCRKCGYVSRGGTDCLRCAAGELAATTLAAALPRMSLEHGVPVEIVKGGAAAGLTRSGGVGVLLRF